MSDKKKKKDKAIKGQPNESPNKLSKEEDAIARFVRFNCQTNTTMFEGNEVHYFSGKKAVDLLVDSKKYGAKAKVPKFAESTSAEDFLETLLIKGLFFRAKKMVLKKKDKTQELKASKSRDVSKSPKVGKNEKKPQETEQQPGGETEENEREDKVEQEEDKKKKKKIKLLFNDVQSFEVDTVDVYVWVFDPTPFWKKCVGVLMVLGTIGGCLFPLWPEWLRLGVYYLSVTGIALFGLLLGVALARTIFFALVWLVTVGRHHIWILPNLMEDCGFFESFQPFYTYEYIPGGFFGDKSESKKKKDDEDAKEEGEGEKEPLLSNSDETGVNTTFPTASTEDTTNAEKTEEEEDEEEGKEVSPKRSQSQEVDDEEEEQAEEEAAQSDSNSNSWERLSENSQKSEGAAAVKQRKSE